MLTMQGKLKGLRPLSEKYPDSLLAGIAQPKKNGYPGEEYVVDVFLTKEQIANGHPKKFEALLGKIISVPVTANASTKRDSDRAFLNFYCAGDPVAVN